MKTASAIQHAGSPKELADLLGITPSAISQWGDEVPPARQLQLERVTRGKVKADPDCLQRLIQPKKPKTVQLQQQPQAREGLSESIDNSSKG